MTDKNRILIVDDDDVVRRSYLRSLEGTSCQVAAARDGEEALQTMEQNPFDVVLLDMCMPGQDGFQLHQRQRRVEAGRDHQHGGVGVAAHRHGVGQGAVDRDDDGPG